MSDKILTEAFDKIRAIEESSDAVDGAEELTDIQEELFELIERLDSAIRAYVPSKHAYWQSYGLAQLKIVAGSDEYATSDESINNLIKTLEDENPADEHEDDMGRPEVGRRGPRGRRR